MKVTDQDTGEDFILHNTDELNAELETVYQACAHKNKELRQKRNKGGALQFIEQCLQCGSSVGLFRKHSEQIKNAPQWDQVLEARYFAEKQERRNAITQKHVRLQKKRLTSRLAAYDAYLLSDVWKQKRTKVIERSKGICEGCGSEKATQAHHLSYDHIFEEFLFELVAVCESCHKRLHEKEASQNQEGEDLDLSDFDGEYIEHPCCGCRYQSEKSNTAWCFISDKTTDFALSEKGDCGPNRALFEPLR